MESYLVPVTGFQLEKRSASTSSSRCIKIRMSPDNHDAEPSQVCMHASPCQVHQPPARTYLPVEQVFTAGSCAAGCWGIPLEVLRMACLIGNLAHKSTLQGPGLLWKLAVTTCSSFCIRFEAICCAGCCKRERERCCRSGHVRLELLMSTLSCSQVSYA